MRRKLLYGLFYLTALLLLSCVLMFLWNGLLPGLTGVRPLNYVQSVGLMVLCRILFGGYHFGPAKPFSGRQGNLLKNKLAGMNDEERAAFKEEWRKRGEERKEY